MCAPHPHTKTRPKQGLLQYEYATGRVSILASHVSDASQLDPGTPITYANDLTIAPDGTIYFTSCTGAEQGL